MDKDLYNEKMASQQPAIDLLIKMGYNYISPEQCLKERGSRYNVILKDILKKQLIKINSYTFVGKENKFSVNNIEKAINDLDEPLIEGLVRTSEKIYDYLLYGKSYLENVGEGKNLSFNLKYIDWDNFENNVFHITEEFSIEMKNENKVINIKEDFEIEQKNSYKNVRPDIVLFINGIPFGVIECKAPYISVEQGIEQTIRNQKNEYIPQLFKFTQILMSTNKNSVKYATCGTPKKFWSVWKEQDTNFLNSNLEKYVIDREPTIQDKNIISLFLKERVKNIIKYFILYDANVKKICRYQQFFAINEVIKNINESKNANIYEGGFIWHTQGSGKSLNMVMLAKYILMEMTSIKPRVIIVTDRKELDRQISTTFAHTGLKPANATTSKNLIELIEKNRADIITTIINKFNTVEKSNVKIDCKNIFIFIDETHRTNYGGLSTKMRTVFPNACYIGFTGTPLMKNQKTSNRFGKLIHKYTIKDGVDDNAIVPLIYEGRAVIQEVDEKNIDLWFEERSKRCNKKQKKDLKNKWSRLQKLNSSSARINMIALDINNHFINTIKETGFKAMLATSCKKDAIRYLDVFEEMGDLNCAVIISKPDIREGEEYIDEPLDNQVLNFWTKMMKKYGDTDKYEETIKNKFCNGEIDILIVCSKLLTGFDAPICQVLYIDKELKEHGLLQAIARTNRLRDGKDYGLIVDYRQLIKKLDDAMQIYSGAGLEYFDNSDLKNIITDIIDIINKLRDYNNSLENLFEHLKNKKDIEEIEVSLANEEKREKFYNLLCNLGKYLNIVLNSEKIYCSLDKNEINQYKDNFVFYSRVRRSVKIRYCDVIDNAEYEPIMQNLLDTHLYVSGLQKITSPINILNKEDVEKEIENLTSNRAKAEAITSKLTKVIKQKYDENPYYYESFSKKIKETLEAFKDKLIDDKDYLNKIRSILEEFENNKSSIVYPDKVKNDYNAQAFYGGICMVLDTILDDIQGKEFFTQDFITDISVHITNIFKENTQVDWKENLDIHKKIEIEIDDLFFNYESEYNIKIDFSIIDKIIEKVKLIAIRRY